MIVTVTFCILGGKDLDKSLPAFRSTLVSATAVLWLYLILVLHKEKRDRLHALLPIPLKQMGMARVFVLFGFWMILLVLFLLTNIIIGNTSSFSTIFWEFMSLTGFIFMVNSAPFIHRDLTFIFLKKYQRFLLTILYIIFVMIGYILFIVFVIPLGNYGSLYGVDEFIRLHLLSPRGAVIFLATGICFTYLSIKFFSR